MFLDDAPSIPDRRGRPPAGRLVPFLVLLLVSACKSPETYEAEADAEAYGVVRWGRELAGQAPEPDFDLAQVDRLRDSLILAHSLDEEPGPRERLALEGASVTVDLASTLEIAARNSREFQTQKETLYLTALDLTGSWHDYQVNWFGMQSVDFAALGDGDDSSRLSLAENGSFGFTRLLEAGGALTLSIGDSVTRFLSDPMSTVATTFATLTLSLPFLRGAGREIAYERVTQAERNVVYSVRQYERFKREFAVSVTSEYLRLLQDAQTAANENRNLDRRRITAEENRALGEAGRLARTDVERANQAELSAENRVVIAAQQFANSRDRFKLTLGIPTDARLEIDVLDLDRIKAAGLGGVPVDETRATLIALRNRLDLATSQGRAVDARRRVAVARDALLAGLDLTASIDLGSNDFGENSFRLDPIGNADYRLGFDLDLPFDRIQERNAYREALIAYDAARRAYEGFEDQVKLQVRSALRNLHQASESYRIQVGSLEVSQTNVDAASLLKDAGQGTTLDLLDAQNDLIAAENAVLDALVNYKIAELQLFRDMGILSVDSRGIDRELTMMRLKEED
ncbi:MAG: TolC family protein [Planctomycetes bacterium]|nr:TolC family protein [Planctomycetota bacterium]